MTFSTPFLAAISGLYSRVPKGWTAGVDLYARARAGRRRPGRLDVMTSYGGRDLDVVQVLLQSLSETHAQDHIMFWLLELRVPAADIQALSRFCDQLPNVTLNVIKVTDREVFDQLRKLGGKPDSARFLWLAAHRHLPADLDRVIYLDALDIIVADDLKPMMRHPFMGKYLVACRELVHLPPVLIGPAQRAHQRWAPDALIRQVSRGIINSGSIVVNLAAMRRDDLNMGQYLKAAEWASGQGLGFGDQGLFSLTHGSHYARAHDRYNHRFFSETDGRVRATRRPAVIHYAGRVPKPTRWHLTPDLERAISDHLVRRGESELVLGRVTRIRPADFPYFRRWWDTCARTPCHARIAPLATERTLRTLETLGVRTG